MPQARRHPAAVSVASLVVLLVVVLSFCSLPLAAQGSQPEAVQAVRSAVASEMEANRTDKSIWAYQDHDIEPGKDAVYNIVETRQGSLRRMVEFNGQPLSGAAAQDEIERVRRYVRDASEQAKSRKNNAHDDAQAAELLKMLPDAFLWTVVSETPELLTLDFRPNPGFSPPDIEARIMGMMAGQMIIARDGNRIRTLRGQLTENVSIGFGLVKMYKGGTFQIERRQVGGGHWQITETHVHIGGHALLFKNIGQQEDEVKTEWKPSPATNLEEAAHTLGVQP